MAASALSLSTLAPNPPPTLSALHYSYSRPNLSFLSHSLSSLKLRLPNHRASSPFIAKSTETEAPVSLVAPETETEAETETAAETVVDVEASEPKRDEVFAVVMVHLTFALISLFFIELNFGKYQFSIVHFAPDSFFSLFGIQFVNRDMCSLVAIAQKCELLAILYFCPVEIGSFCQEVYKCISSSPVVILFDMIDCFVVFWFLYCSTFVFGLFTVFLPHEVIQTIPFMSF